MNVLVVNIGSTSFKFRLFDMTGETVLARGGIEGVGKEASKTTLQVGGADAVAGTAMIPDQPAAVEWCLNALRTADEERPVQVDAVGFKAVHGGTLPEAARVTPEVLDTMAQFADAAPAHNPAYIAAMRGFQTQQPELPLVAAFETGFHRTISPARSTYAIPREWTETHGVRRYGFHGASHRYIATRTAELLGRQDLRLISCHLGGSSSICAIRAGRSVANSFGMTPQTGLPHNNRVGDFDPYALLVLRARTGKDIDALLGEAAKQGGLLGISGLSNEMPELLAAAAEGNEAAELAVAAFVESIRDFIGAYVVALGGLDALVFTGGIGERSTEIRRRVCAGLAFLGVELDEGLNATGAAETSLSLPMASVTVMTVPTNEELVVARQTVRVLTTG